MLQNVCWKNILDYFRFGKPPAHGSNLTLVLVHLILGKYPLCECGSGKSFCSPQRDFITGIIPLGRGCEGLVMYCGELRTAYFISTKC
jgi:hypothetical protein